MVFLGEWRRINNLLKLLLNNRESSEIQSGRNDKQIMCRDNNYTNYWVVKTDQLSPARTLQEQGTNASNFASFQHFYSKCFELFSEDSYIEIVPSLTIRNAAELKQKNSRRTRNTRSKHIPVIADRMLNVSAEISPFYSLKMLSLITFLVPRALNRNTNTGLLSFELTKLELSSHRIANTSKKCFHLSQEIKITFSRILFCFVKESPFV